MAVLSKPDIIIHHELGNLIIEPYFLNQVCDTSYDLRIGNMFFVQRTRNRNKYFNPFDKNDVKNLWGKPFKAYPASKWRSIENPLTNINDDDLIILVRPIFQ